MKIVASIALASLFAVMPSQAALQDPTRPPTAKAAAQGVFKKAKRVRWVLNSTLVSAGRRSAVINDKVVARGEFVNGARVISIEPSRVRLKMKGREITLVMLKKKVKSLSRVAVPERIQ